MVSAATDAEERAGPFELYALRYATNTGRTAHENFVDGDPHDAGADLDYFIWLARRGEEVFLIDTGFGPDAAKARGRTLLRRPTEALALMGVEAGAVREVILTHLHYDHAGTLGDFPEARFHLQVSEAACATGPCICTDSIRAPYDVENIVDYVRKLYAGRIVFCEGDRKLADGLWLHAVPGHSAGLQAVRVFTQRGWVVVASDATHYYANMGQKKPFPIFFDMDAMIRSYDRVAALAPDHDHIVPGHDPQVMAAYPAPSPELQDIVVRLDVAPRMSWAELAE